MDYIGNPDYDDKSILFSKIYPKINHDSPEEIRADRFAAELLMPKKVFLAEYVKVKLYSKADLSYVTNGQNVPDDIEVFDTQKIVKQLLGGNA